MSHFQIRLMLAIMSISFAIGATQAYAEQQHLKKFFPGHYLYATIDRGSGLPPLGSNEDKLKRQRILGNNNWVGYHIEYKWSVLEPSFGVYDFTKIRADLATAQSDGKVISLIIQERAWGSDPFPGPSYMNPDSPDYNSNYDGMYFPSTDWQHAGNATPNLWKTLFGDRMVKLINALGAEFDSHPSLAAIGFQETAVPGMSTQQGYTGAQYATYLKRIHTAAAAAFPTTIVYQTTNWGSGMSAAEIEEVAVHIVEVCKGAIGGSDLMGNSYALENAFGKYYRKYRGIAPLFHRAEPATYSRGPSVQQQFDYSIDTIGDSMQAWSAWRGLGTTFTPVFTVDDVIPEVDRQLGRVNTVIPSNLIKPTPIPTPDGFKIVSE